MVTATVLFPLAAVFGHSGYVAHDVSVGPFLLTLVGFAILTLGGFIGGSIVFLYGMRVEAAEEDESGEA